MRDCQASVSAGIASYFPTHLDHVAGAARNVKRGRMQYQDKGLMTIVLLADTTVHVR